MAGRVNEKVADFDFVLKTADKLKRVMQKKGLTRARAKCPRCEGMLHGSIGGARKHLHMHCDGSCKMMFME